MTAVAEVAEVAPAHVTDEETGQRFYPIDGENFWSCSTVVGVIDKSGLTYWAGGLAAAFAFDELPTILTASRIKACERSYRKCKHEWRMPCIPGECRCHVCEGCIRQKMSNLHDVVKRSRAKEGRETHDVVEWWALHDGEWIGYRPEVAPYVEAFKAFVAEYGVRPDDFLWSEAIVVNREHKYAGTTDGILRIHADRTPAAAELVARVMTAEGTPITADEAAAHGYFVTLVIDFKTQDKVREDEKFYADQALQCVGYRRAQTIRIKNTQVEQPMPETDGALLIHLRPDGCTARLVVADDRTFGAFLAALALFTWIDEYGTASVSSRSFPLPKPVKAARPRTKATTAARPTNKATPAKRAAAPAGPARTAAMSLGVFPNSTARPAGAQLTDESIPF